MHKSLDEWTPRPTKSRKGKSWRVVIPARFALGGKQTSKYFDNKEDAEKYIGIQKRNLSRFGTVSGKNAGFEAYKLHALEDLLNEIGVSPVDAVTQYVELVKEAGSVAKLLMYVKMGRGVSEIPPDQSPSLRELAIMAAREKKHLSDVTRISRATRLSKMERTCPDIYLAPCASITADMIKAALDKCHSGHPTSWNNLRREVSVLFNIATKRGFISKNPCNQVAKMHVLETEIIALSPEQLISLFRACSPPQSVNENAGNYKKRLEGQDTTGLLLYVALGAFAGIRPFEIPRLKWEDISLEDNVVSVRASHAKTGGARHVHINSTLRKWILFCMPEVPNPQSVIIDKTDLKTKTYALRLRAGFNDSNPWPHDCLRHSFASYSIKNGHNLNQLSHDMGHVDLSLLKTRYLNMRGLTKDIASKWWNITPDFLNIKK